MRSAIMILIWVGITAFCIDRVTSTTQPAASTRPPMSLEEMTARSANITGRLMSCFGAPGAAQCRPVELQQAGNPEIVRPVVVCLDSACRLAPEPIK
jgi:hypothetical protein